MDQKILSAVDHTLLTQTATWAEVKQICDDAVEYRTASVCIPPSYVKRAKEYVGDRMKVCTVIGFPNGYQTAEVKEVLEAGADEIDMVISIGALKDGDYETVKSEIQAVKAACKGRILKVIIETCLLTEDEKITMCRIVSESGADFIKTSTGFSKAGATFGDIALFKAHVDAGVKIKAAGGIGSEADAEKFLALGTDRLGTSRIVKLAKQEHVESDSY